MSLSHAHNPRLWKAEVRDYKLMSYASHTVYTQWTLHVFTDAVSSLTYSIISIQYILIMFSLPQLPPYPSHFPTHQMCFFFSLKTNK